MLTQFLEFGTKILPQSCRCVSRTLLFRVLSRESVPKMRKHTGARTKNAKSQKWYQKCENIKVPVPKMRKQKFRISHFWYVHLFVFAFLVPTPCPDSSRSNSPSQIAPCRISAAMMRSYLFLLPLLCLLFRCTHSASAVECLSKGFNSETLKCATCDLLERVVGATSGSGAEGSSPEYNVNVIEECQLCCNAELASGDGAIKHSKVILEVDKRYLFSFPTIKEIIKAKSDSTKGKKSSSSSKLAEVVSKFEVRYRLGQRPSLLLFSDSGGEAPVDTLSIYSWDMDTFIDYLNDHVI